MRKHLVLAASLLLWQVTPAVASAQDDVEAFSTLTFDSYRSFMGTAKTLIRAASLLREARGIKDESGKIAQMIADLDKPMTKMDSKLLAVASTQMENDTKEIALLTDSVVVMTAEMKTKATEGIIQYAKGVGETTLLALTVPALVEGAAKTVSSLAKNPLQFRKVKDAVDIAKTLGGGVPMLAKGHVTAVSSLKNLISKQGLKVDPAVFLPPKKA